VAKVNFVTMKGYPLVYERENDEEKLLVIINPTAESSIFEYPETLGEILYLNGKSVKQDGKTVQISGQSAAVIKVR
jgi:pullulanase/glycogen debranching enzyme